MFSHLFVKRGIKQRKTHPHLFNATFTQLQHGQVVVGLSVVIIKGQSQFETLVGQCQVSDAL